MDKRELESYELRLNLEISKLNKFIFDAGIALTATDCKKVDTIVLYYTDELNDTQSKLAQMTAITAKEDLKIKKANVKIVVKQLINAPKLRK